VIYRNDERRGVFMKAGVISDTHLSSGGMRRLSSRLISGISESMRELEELLNHYFQDVDAVLHAGDLVDLEVVKVLENFGEVYVVAGNMDPGDVRARYPEKRVVELGGFKIGMMHGWGKPEGLAEKVRAKFDDVDCIIFGHTHRPFNEDMDGVLMFNPGSALDRRFAPFRSLGILHIEDKIQGEIIQLPD
jgi:putative phosphoesterase